ALDDLVELAAVEPDAAAGGAVVDLDAAALAHLEHGSVGGALHGEPPVVAGSNGRVPAVVPGTTLSRAAKGAGRYSADRTRMPVPPRELSGTVTAPEG